MSLLHSLYRMVGLEEKYIGGDWIPPFLSISVDFTNVPATGESTKAASEELATAIKSSPLAELVNKESTTSVPSSTSISPNNEPAALILVY